MNVTVLADALAPVLRELVGAATAPLLRRLDALEETLGKELPTLQVLRREVEALPASFETHVAGAIDGLPKAPTAEEVAALIPAPEPGKDADPAATAALVADEVAKAVAALPRVEELVAAEVATAVSALPKPVDGRSVTIDEVRPLVDDAVAAGFATLRVPEDGKSVDPEDVRAMVTEEVAKAIDAAPKPENGKDADPLAVAALVEDAVTKAIAGLPPAKAGKDGVSPTADDVRPVIEEVVARSVAALPKAKDGIGVAGAIIDRDGILNLTLSDGAVVKLGAVVGDAGNDGLGFDDLDVIDDGTTFTLRFQRGEQTKEFTLAKPTLADCYRGVWREGAFKAGDACTWGGSLWIAQRDTEAKPESDDAWRLAVKRGRDGKDAEQPKPPARVKL